MFWPSSCGPLPSWWQAPQAVVNNRCAASFSGTVGAACATGVLALLNDAR
jgi:hypothetical protein